MEDAARPAFATLLRRERIDAGLSQEDLAERAGLSPRAISDLERGLRRAPHRPTVDRLADALHLSQEDRAALASSVSRHRERAQSASHVEHRHLPVPLTSFVGRERDVAEVGRLVQTARLVTIAGPPGIGKSRLALHVAASLEGVFPDGVRLAELASVSDPALVVREVAAALDMIEPSTRPLAHEVGSRKLLLVLDNCEHLIASCARLASELLSACPRLHIVTTTRQSLGIIGEMTYRLPPLPHADAARLFLERASALSDRASANADAVTRVCQRLDGIPLAIEPAAVWVRALGVEQIAGPARRPLPTANRG